MANKKAYRCEQCCLSYKDKEWTQRCEDWCKENTSCKLNTPCYLAGSIINER
ncbi:MAG: hypothetical protein Q8Q31_00250 [Nanoarchaeota archaeon]|nr:hypothetical protein [Nanoarchaeota archaeon]